MNKSSLYSFIVHINPEQMVNLVSFCNFVDVIKNIKFYSLFIKSFTIHRTIKVPGTFNSLQFLSLVISLILCFVTSSTSLTASFFGKFFLALIILYFTSELTNFTITGLASPIFPDILCIAWISDGSTFTFSLSFTISLTNISLILTCYD